MNCGKNCIKYFIISKEIDHFNSKKHEILKVLEEEGIA